MKTIEEYISEKNSFRLGGSSNNGGAMGYPYPDLKDVAEAYPVFKNIDNDEWEEMSEDDFRDMYLSIDGKLALTPEKCGEIDVSSGADFVWQSDDEEDNAMTDKNHLFFTNYAKVPRYTYKMFVVVLARTMKPVYIVAYECSD